MRYTQVTFRLQSDSDFAADLLTAALSEIHFDSFEETTRGIVAYCPTALFDEAAMNTAIAALPVPLTYDYRIADMPDIDWNAAWEQNSFTPIDIDGRCIIHNTRTTPTHPYEYDITIDPQQAFGSGNHETTRLIIRNLISMDLVGKTILDMGCGTGILAILAAKRGAAHIAAVDIDEWSVRNTTANCALNHIDNICALLGSVEQVSANTYDIILANINRNILLQDMHHYAEALQPGGQLFMSGFYVEDLPIIEEECQRNGLRVEGYKERHNWVAVKVVKA